MVFTWSIESILLGLVAVTLVQDYLTVSLLVLSCATGALHLLCAATTLDGYYTVAISHLCTLTGMLLSASLRPLDTMNGIILVALLGVAELASLGMVFASSDGGTALFFHSRGNFALLICLILEGFLCAQLDGFIRNRGDFGLATAFTFIALQLAPFDTLATILGAAGCATLAAAFYFLKMPFHMYVAIAVGALSVLWAVGVWIPVWFPTVTLEGLRLLPAFTVGGITIDPVPVLITVFLVLFALGCVCIGAWQIFLRGNWLFFGIMATPVALVCLWIVLLWVFDTTRKNVAPVQSLPEPAALPRVSMRWPRMKLPLKEV